MTALILCTPKVLLQNAASEWRSATGGNAILISGRGDVSISQAVERIGQSAFLETHLFENYENSDLVERAVLDLRPRRRITAVLSFSEVDVSRAARIRKHLGLTGQTAEDGEFFRNKVLMKRRAWERGVAVPRFAQVTCPADLLDFISANGLPVVVKPYDGRGSAGVDILESEKDIRTFLARGSSTSMGFTVEQFVPGDMYRIDGLYVDGSPVIIHAGRYLKDCLAFIRGETIGTHSLDQGNPLSHRIETFTRHLLERALPFPKTSIFHLQIFHTPDDRLVLCEVASRLGGGVINEEVRLATGIDIKMSYVKASVGTHEELGANTLPPVPAGRIIIPPRRGTLRKLPAACDYDWVDTYKAYGVIGREYGGAAMTNAEVASFVFRGDNEEHLQARAKTLESWFHANSEWSA